MNKEKQRLWLKILSYIAGGITILFTALGFLFNITETITTNATDIKHYAKKTELNRIELVDLKKETNNILIKVERINTKMDYAIELIKERK